MKVAGPGVVTETCPEVQHLILAGVGQDLKPRKSCHEIVVVGDDSGHLSLLQHNLRDPDPIGCYVLLPGQVFATVLIEPGQQACSKVLHVI